MLFGSYNKQNSSKKVNPLIWAGLLLAALPLASLFFRFMDERRDVVEVKPARVVSYSDRVRQTEALCESVPKPDEFYLVDKMAPYETARYVAVSYKYASPRSQEELFPIFIIWFNSNGWTDNRTPYKPLEFSKNERTIGISPVRAMDGDYYLITCTEWILD